MPFAHLNRLFFFSSLMATPTFATNFTDQNDYLSFTARSSLVSAGSNIVWLEKLRGTVNIFGCQDLPTSPCKPRALTSFTDADDVSISRLTLADNGKNILFTRGEGTAASSAAPLSTATFVLPFSTSLSNTPVLVAPHVLVATTGGRATFALWSDGFTTISEAPYADAAVMQTLQPLVHTAGTLGLSCSGNGPAVAWSPDGQTLAFAVKRLDHGFVGIWRRNSRRVRWLAPSMDVDGCPVWSPDGKRLAFVRLRANDGVELPPSNTASTTPYGLPLLHQAPTFSLMVAHMSERRGGGGNGLAAAVAVTEAFREAADSGYVGTGENGYGSRPLLWTADGTRLLVGSEASGYTHILAVNATGDVAKGTSSFRDLTPKDKCEHQGWALGDDAGGEVLYTANSCGTNGDVLSISRVTIATGARVDVTDPSDPYTAAGLSNSGSGMVSRKAGGLAYLATSFNTSTSLFLWSPGDRGGGAHSSVPTTREVTQDDIPPKAFANFVKPKLVAFPSTDGLVTLHGQLFQGVGGSNGPAAIFTHGGSQRQMYASMHFSQCYAQLYTYCQQLALSGITVLSINYRSGVGYGRDYRLCGKPTGPPTKRCGMQGALEYDDVRAGRAWLRAQFAPSAVGIFGLSYGGLNCLQAMSRDPADYKAGACNAPVFNWVSQLRFDGATFFDPAHKLPFEAPHQLPIGPESTLAGPTWLAKTQALQAQAWSSSPVAHMNNISGPLLLIQGDLDEEVPFQESLSLARHLRAKSKGVNLETLFFPDECHGECAYTNQLVVSGATVAFLKKHLL